MLVRDSRLVDSLALPETMAVGQVGVKPSTRVEFLSSTEIAWITAGTKFSREEGRGKKPAASQSSVEIGSTSGSLTLSNIE